jgi:ABC-type transport system involved in cytochrome bd biosynthesis fused ATPase/permease subunit
VSQHQARALALAAVLLGEAPLLALDSPCAGLKKRAATRRLDVILSRAEGRTLVVTFPELTDASRFDLVLVLRRGRMAFHGTPSEWKAWKATKRKKEVLLCKA